MKYRVLAALSAAAILVATLHPGGEELAAGWSFSITSGDAAVAELIQNLLLFLPLGAFLVLAGVKPVRAIVAGTLLSFSVEFAQQFIPGRDPSVGDIIVNTASTALGVALVVYGPRLLFTTAQRAAWQALGTAVVAVLAWTGTGVVLHQSFPPPPYQDVAAPDFNRWAHYNGAIVWTKRSPGVLSVQALFPAHPPSRSAPMVALLGASDVPVLILSVDGHDLALRYHMPAVDLTLEQPDLRWRGALAGMTPSDTFTAGTSSDGANICLGLNGEKRCGLGYTIGDGWKLIFYPDRWPSWALAFINACWVAGCVIGVGWWAARTSEAVEGGQGRSKAVIARIAVAIVIVGLIMVPWFTGLKGTTLVEWIGGLLGIELGLTLGSRSTPRH